VAAEDPAADLAIVVLENLVAIKPEDLVTIVLQNLEAIKKQDLRQKHVGKKLNRSDSSLEI
jgi:phosphoglucomutase